MDLLTAGPNTDSFCSLYEADVYHSNRLHISDWSGATNAEKKSALIWATNLIVQQIDFYSSPLNQNQKLPAPFAISDSDTYRTYYGTEITGTWTQSITNNDLYYLDNSVTELDKLVMDGLELAQGYVVDSNNYLETGEYGFGDLDVIGSDRLYFRIFNEIPSSYTFTACYFYTGTGRTSISPSFIPDEIKYATAEYALVLVKSDVTATTDTIGVKSMKLGTMAFSFDPYDRIAKMPSQASDYLKNFGKVKTGYCIEIGRG